MEGTSSETVRYGHPARFESPVDCRGRYHRGMRLGVLVGLFALAGTMGCGRESGAAAESNAASEFDAAAWQTADSNTRGRMCADLMSKHELVGMPLDDVIALLGEPSSSNHCVWYWVGPTSDTEHSAGRFKIYFEHDIVTSLDRDGLPSPRPAPVAFDRGQWLGASSETRLSMLDGALALESEFLGRARAVVEDFFGPPSGRWHDAYYELSPVDDDPGGFSFFRQRQLLLTIDERAVVTDAVDKLVTD
jgi:hypothetical protein